MIPLVSTQLAFTQGVEIVCVNTIFVNPCDLALIITLIDCQMLVDPGRRSANPRKTLLFLEMSSPSPNDDVRQGADPVDLQFVDEQI